MAFERKGQSATQGVKVQLEGYKNIAYVSTYDKTTTATR